MALKGSRFQTPLPFREYCQAAIRQAEAQTGELPSNTIMKEGTQFTFILSLYDNIRKSTIKKQIPTFEGASLVLADGSNMVRF